MSITVMNRVWRRSRVAGTARLLLLALADHANEEGICWPGRAILAERTCLSQRQTRRLLRQLEESGELYVVRGGGALWQTNRYAVLSGLEAAEIAALLERGFGLSADEAGARAAALIARRGEAPAPPLPPAPGGGRTGGGCEGRKGAPGERQGSAGRSPRGTPPGTLSGAARHTGANPAPRHADDRGATADPGCTTNHRRVGDTTGPRPAVHDSYRGVTPDERRDLASLYSDPSPGLSRTGDAAGPRAEDIFAVYLAHRRAARERGGDTRDPRGDIGSARGDSQDTTGDSQGARGDSRGGGGDTAMSPEPPIEPSKEPSIQPSQDPSQKPPPPRVRARGQEEEEEDCFPSADRADNLARPAGVRRPRSADGGPRTANVNDQPQRTQRAAEDAKGSLQCKVRSSKRKVRERDQNDSDERKTMNAERKRQPTTAKDAMPATLYALRTTDHGNTTTIAAALEARGIFAGPAAEIARRVAANGLTAEDAADLLEDHLAATGGNLAVAVWRLKHAPLTRPHRRLTLRDFLRDDHPPPPQIEPEEAEAKPSTCNLQPATVDIWQRALASLQGQMTEATFNRWLRSSHLLEERDGALVVSVHDPAAIPWLTRRLDKTVRRALEGTAGRPLDVHYVARSAA